MKDEELEKLLRSCGAEMRRMSESEDRMVAAGRVRRATQTLAQLDVAPERSWFSFGISFAAGIACLLLAFQVVRTAGPFSISGKTSDRTLAESRTVSTGDGTIEDEIGDAYAQLQTVVWTDDDSLGNDSEDEEGDDEVDLVEVNDANPPEYLPLTVESPNMFYEEESDNETETFFDS